MIRHAKRNFGVISSVLALLAGIILLLLNGVLLADRILCNATGEDFALDQFLFISIDCASDLDPYTTKLSEMEPFFTVFYTALFVVALFMIVSAIKYCKKPVDRKGNITYKNGLLSLILILCVVELVVVVIGLIGLPDFNFIDYETLKVYCILIIAVSALSVIFSILSFCTKKNVYKANYKLKPIEKQKIDIETIHANAKVQKLQQLRKLGTISEQEYKEAVAKDLHGV